MGLGKYGFVYFVILIFGIHVLCLFLLEIDGSLSFSLFQVHPWYALMCLINCLKKELGNDVFDK
jgi:hypothetical protein